MRQFTCIDCGLSFEAGRSGPLPDRCKKCRRSFLNDYYRNKRVSVAPSSSISVRECPYCKLMYVARVSANRPSASCLDCRAERKRQRAKADYARKGRKTRAARTAATCECCGREVLVRPFDLANRGWKKCRPCASRDAQKIAARRSADKRTASKQQRKSPNALFVSGPCSECKAVFTCRVYEGGSAASYCSKECARRAAWRRHYARQGWFAITKARRRAIYERDDWTCQLCSGQVEDGLPPSDIWAATLDHIIPRSRGGGDEDENLQLAHRWCNSKKSDRTEFAAA